AGVGDLELEVVGAVEVGVGLVGHVLGAAQEGAVGGERGRALLERPVRGGLGDREVERRGRRLEVGAGELHRRRGSVLVDRVETGQVGRRGRGGRLVVDRVDRDRDRLGGARLGGVAAGAGGAAVVGVATVGDLVGEGVGAVVVGIRHVGAAAAAAGQGAVGRAADDRVGQVGARGLYVLALHDALPIYRVETGQVGRRGRGGRLVVDRVDRDRDRLGGARLGGVAAGAGG